jgi:O-antigen ligase
MGKAVKKTFHKYHEYASSLLWALFLLTMPFTSLPLVVKLIGGQMVAVPSGLIVLAIIIVWLLPKLLQGISIPKHTLPLFLFVFIALVSVIIGYWRYIPAFKGINPLKENLESIITLGMGVCCYLVTMLWLREKNSKEEFKKTLRLITYGGILIIVKAFAEVVLWKIYGRWPVWFRGIHNLFVTGTLFRSRVTAFAYEPSWLADQLNLLFLPYWLACALTRYTVFKRKIWKFHVEDLCLGLGIMTLFFTLSRLGYLSFLLMLGIIFLRGTAWFTNWVQEKIQIRFPKFQERKARAALLIGIYFFVLLFYLGLIFAAVFMLSKLDYRNEEIFEINFETFNLMKYAEKLGFGARITYWQGGWNIFNKYPIFGIGLGNAGFYFTDLLPPYAWRLVEIREYFFHSNILLNIKSMWFRVLAETGIVGFAAFTAFHDPHA